MVSMSMASIRQIRPALSPFIQQTIYRQKIIPSSFQAPEQVINTKLQKHTNVNFYSSTARSFSSALETTHKIDLMVKSKKDISLENAPNDKPRKLKEVSCRPMIHSLYSVRM